MEFRKLEKNEWPAAFELLAKNRLPTADMTDRAELFGLFDGEKLIGTGGLEDFGSAFLLRSVAVETGRRGEGLGQFIVAEVEDVCHERGIERLVLMTDSAAAFFEKCGFETIDRASAPAEIQKSQQFSGLCPSSATAMEKDLTQVKKLLFVCIENSNRSQMAQAFANLFGKGKARGFSAGSRPSGRVNPKAVEAMQLLGYDLGRHHSKSVEEAEKFGPFEAVVTMGCGDACPWVAAKTHVDWAIPDPRNMEKADFLAVRDLIGEKVRALIGE